MYARQPDGDDGEDYIRTARAKGLSETRVVLKHGLRAGLTPIVTVFGLDLGGLLGGAIITETDLQPARHRPTHGAVGGQPDLYAIVDITLVAACFVVVANLVVDIVYAFLDPGFVPGVAVMNACLSLSSRSRTSSVHFPTEDGAGPGRRWLSLHGAYPARPSAWWGSPARARACPS